MGALSVVWVTGASRGIGRALASTVPWADARVIGISRGDPGAAHHLKADLSIDAGWQAVRASFRNEVAAADELDRVAFVHAAAAVEPIGFAGEVDPREYTRAVLLNTVAPQLLGRAFIEATADLDCSRYLGFLTTGSSSGPYPGWSAYKSGKAAVDAWAELEAVAAEDTNLRVLAIAPGLVKTDMQAAIRKSEPDAFPRREKFTSAYESGELADPARVAARIWNVLTSTDTGLGPLVDLRELDEH